MKILNGAEAFEAMSAGQKIEARHAGSDLDFDEIRNFPATVFIDQDYEFRIAVIYMTIGLMQVPEAIKEAPAKGTACFAPSLLTSELSKSFKWKNSESDLELLVRGLVHLYDEHAMTHARALIAVSQGLVSTPIKNEVELPWDEEDKTGEVREPIDQSKWPESKVPSQNFIKMWLNRAKDEPTRRNLDAMKANIDHNWELLDPDHQLQASKIYADFENLVQRTENNSIETDPAKLVEKYTAQISEFTKVDDVLSFRHVFLANGHLDQDDQHYLCKLCEDKLLLLDPKQYTPKAKPAPENLSVDELKQLQVEAEKLVAERKLAETAEIEYQKALSELLDGVAKANTPTEVTAHTRYTKRWTEEQRKPLLDAIHKRLQELAPVEAEIKMPPSLMVQIQNAPDLTTLDALEIDVSARDPSIQSKLMGYVKRRRFELENQASEVTS